MVAESKVTFCFDYSRSKFLLIGSLNTIIARSMTSILHIRLRGMAVGSLHDLWQEVHIKLLGSEKSSL